MPLRLRPALVSLFLLTAGHSSPAAERPITGMADPAFAPVDAAVEAFMDKVGATAAAIAVSRGCTLVYSRGFGWKDEDLTKPLPPDALFRIASVTKPFTAAAVRASVRAGSLSLDAKAFDVAKVEPAGGSPGDPRLGDVTVQHLLAHRGGWDRDASFDPMFRTRQAARDMKLDGPPAPRDMVAWMLAKPLDFAPGEKSVYSNFGYCVLGRVLEAVEKKPYFEAVRELVLTPAGIADVKLGETAKRDPREVRYPVADGAFRLEVMDAHGGLIASAPAVCRFLDHYWIGGERRDNKVRGHGTFFGSLPGTTAMARQRPDGVNVVVLLNGRRDRHINDDFTALREAMDAAVDKAMK